MSHRKNHNEKAMRRYLLDTYTGDAKRVKSIARDIIEQGRSVYNYPANVHNHPEEARRLADHFQGLPDPFHPEFEYYAIEEQLKAWGVLPKDATPSRVERMTEGYWIYWARWIFEKAEL